MQRAAEKSVSISSFHTINIIRRIGDRGSVKSESVVQKKKIRASAKLIQHAVKKKTQHPTESSNSVRTPETRNAQ